MKEIKILQEKLKQNTDDLVTLEECMKTNFIVRTYRNVLKVFSPIL